jgi:hypothetical protein
MIRIGDVMVLRASSREYGPRDSLYMIVRDFRRVLLRFKLPGFLHR